MSENDNLSVGLKSAAEFDSESDEAAVQSKKISMFKFILISVALLCILAGVLVKFGVIDLDLVNNDDKQNAISTAFLEMDELIVNLDTRGRGGISTKIKGGVRVKRWETD